MNKYEKAIDIYIKQKGISSTIDGLYYSHKTGRIFEARVKRGKVQTQYLEGDFGPTVSMTSWNLQRHLLEFYDLLAEY